jgi:hypothetical protein
MSKKGIIYNENDKLPYICCNKKCNKATNVVYRSKKTYEYICEKCYDKEKGEINESKSY